MMGASIIQKPFRVWNAQKEGAFWTVHGSGHESAGYVDVYLFGESSPMRLCDERLANAALMLLEKWYPHRWLDRIHLSKSRTEEILHVCAAPVEEDDADSQFSFEEIDYVHDIEVSE
jgi:hypothetical protein